MQILLFGATGLLGRHILAELLAKNHKVTALVRSRSRVDPKLVSSPNLTIVEGDVLTQSDVEKLFANKKHYDAIISAIGEDLEVKLKLKTRATRILLDVLNSLGEKKPRMLEIGGAGLTDSQEKDAQGNFIFLKDTSHNPPKYKATADEHGLAFDMVRKV